MFALHLRLGLVSTLLAVLSAGCAEPGTKEMVAKPKPFAAGEGSSSADRRVVLFRATVDIDGKPMEEPWSLHFSGLGLFVVAGPKDSSFTNRHSFLPGRPNAAASDDGWGFLALRPGAYKLVFEGTAIRFALAGAQYFPSEAVPFGRSPPSVFVVPEDGGLIYIGTFSFTCHEPTSRPDALKAECSTLEIRNEAQEAQKVAQTSLSKYGAMQEMLASPPETKSSP